MKFYLFLMCMALSLFGVSDEKIATYKAEQIDELIERLYPHKPNRFLLKKAKKLDGKPTLTLLSSEDIVEPINSTTDLNSFLEELGSDNEKKKSKTAYKTRTYLRLKFRDPSMKGWDYYINGELGTGYTLTKSLSLDDFRREMKSLCLMGFEAGQVDKIELFSGHSIPSGILYEKLKIIGKTFHETASLKKRFEQKISLYNRQVRDAKIIKELSATQTVVFCADKAGAFLEENKFIQKGKITDKDLLAIYRLLEEQVKKEKMDFTMDKLFIVSSENSQNNDVVDFYSVKKASGDLHAHFHDFKACKFVNVILRKVDGKWQVLEQVSGSYMI